MTAIHQGFKVIILKFLVTQDTTVKEQLIKSGYKPLPNHGGDLYIFQNVPKLKVFCKEKLQDGTYIFTDKMFF